MAEALDAAGGEVFTPDRRAFVTRRRGVIAAHLELQEREALKGIGLTGAMVDALKDRGVPDLTARVAAGLGTLAFEIAYDRWADPANHETFSDLARKALEELHAASASC